MKIELLYLDDCPNWRQTWEDIATVLHGHHLVVDIDLIKVTSAEEAEQMAFSGSPTVRVDGFDVDPDAPTSGFGLGYRIYAVEEDEPEERPPKEWIAAALEWASG
jgi:hypothetical protein